MGSVIQRFNGCQPFPAYPTLQSDAIFTITNTVISHRQMVIDIIMNLRKTYHIEQNIPFGTLGKVYVVYGTRDGEFEVVEHRSIF